MMSALVKLLAPHLTHSHSNPTVKGHDMNTFNIKNTKTAFTLIELLVVISIISLLISILLPALGAARKRAQMMQCLSNHRSVGMGMLMYLDDFDMRFPTSGSFTAICEFNVLFAILGISIRN